MKKRQPSRRNFLGSIAILTAGTVLGSTVHGMALPAVHYNLQEKWMFFSTEAGGQPFHSADIESQPSPILATSGHRYQQGEAIYFEHENMIAQPTWIYWENNPLQPADVFITLYDNHSSLKKITRLNRFELDALYMLSKEHSKEPLLPAICNNLPGINKNASLIVKNKTSILKNKQVQTVCFFKHQSLVYQKQFIHHS